MPTSKNGKAHGRAYPYPAPLGQPVTIKPAPSKSFAGFAILMPDSASPKANGQKIIYRVAMFANRQTGPVTFDNLGEGLMVIDVPPGFKLTPKNLLPIAKQMAKGVGMPPGPGKILPYP